MKKIHLIDCGLGNLKSVSNAFEILDCKTVICSSPGQLKDSTHIILPGVGSFNEGIIKLNESGLSEGIVSAVKSGSKLLGICLGMQFLFDKSYEFGENEGLHLIPGKVQKMDLSEHKLRIPHIGWNDTFIIKDDPLFNGLRNPTCFYYINSFSCICDNSENILGEYEYGNKFVAIVRKDKVFGVQFHPEKSHKEGLKILSNFIKDYAEKTFNTSPSS
mgnify:CR=1 FL=1